MTDAVVASRNAGFTLIEALVATLLMSLIFAALGTVTAQWLPSWNRGLAVVQRTELAAEGLDRLADDLSEAQYFTTGPRNDPPFFDGSELSVVFVRTTLAPNAGPSIEAVRIAEASSDHGPALVRSTATLPTGREDPAGENLEFSDPVVVIHSPYRVSFSYAGTDRVWRDDWHAQPVLPRAVRIKVRDNETSTLLAVSTSTLIHADLAARCVWAVNTAGCPNLGGSAPKAAGSAVNAGAR